MQQKGGRFNLLGWRPIFGMIGYRNQVPEPPQLVHPVQMIPTPSRDVYSDQGFNKVERSVSYQSLSSV